MYSSDTWYFSQRWTDERITVVCDEKNKNVIDIYLVDFSLNIGRIVIVLTD